MSSSQIFFFWLLDGKGALSQHEHVCEWLQRLGTQIWSSHSEITAVDRRGADSRNKLELFANWAISGWGKGGLGGGLQNAAPIFCNTFIYRTKKKCLRHGISRTGCSSAHKTNASEKKKEINKCRNPRGGGKVEREREKKSLILVTFHHTKTSDMLGVKSGFKKRAVWRKWSSLAATHEKSAAFPTIPVYPW